MEVKFHSKRANRAGLIPHTLIENDIFPVWKKVDMTVQNLDPAVTSVRVVIEEHEGANKLFIVDNDHWVSEKSTPVTGERGEVVFNLEADFNSKNSKDSPPCTMIVYTEPDRGTLEISYRVFSKTSGPNVVKKFRLQQQQKEQEALEAAALQGRQEHVGQDRTTQEQGSDQTVMVSPGSLGSTDASNPLQFPPASTSSPLADAPSLFEDDHQLYEGHTMSHGQDLHLHE